MNKFFAKAKTFIRTYPKKHHVEYLSALLSIPVLITVIILNFSNIGGSKNNQDVTPTQAPIIIREEVPTSTTQTNNAPTSATCKKTVGPISIASPTEGQTVTENPVTIVISYQDTSYCSVVWSFRINGGEWSSYISNNPALYNLPSGNIKFELRVQSTVSQDSETIERNFIYKGTTTAPTPTITPASTPQPTPTPTI